ncbi:hypothetical protein PFISCL1PPCAC_17739, partial [Pristionchus fissidentatus]
RLSQYSTGTETEDEVEEEEEGTVLSQFFIVDKKKVDTLFRRCQECGGLIDPTSVEWKQVASALFATYQCTECKEWMIWESQIKKGRGKSKVFQLNQELPMAAFVTGCPIPRLQDTCDLLKLAVPKERSMREIIRVYACPAIDRVHGEMERFVRNLSKDAAPQLVDDGFKIRTRVSDSNAMVDKRLRENEKLKGIETKRDFWHVQKPLRKEWWTGMKRSDCQRLLEWYKPFF